MTKQQFLRDLVDILEEYDLSEQDIRDIEEEYASMIDDALENGETLDDFVRRMGSAKKIAKSLGYQRPEKKSKITSLMPFISTAVFFLFGVLYNAWHPAWLVFLLIPVSAILNRKRIPFEALSVFFILTIFILLGTYENLWNPTWSLFLLISVFNRPKSPTFFISFSKIYTVISVVLYHLIVLNVRYTWWPMENGDVWVTWSPLIFLPVVIFAFFNGMIRISIDGDIEAHNGKALLEFGILVGLLTLLYVFLGLQWNLWSTSWVIYFLLPSYYIVKGSKGKLPITPLMPFVATTLFILVGEYIALPNRDNSYALSWLFFLLIPVSGILLSKKGDR